FKRLLTRSGLWNGNSCSPTRTLPSPVEGLCTWTTSGPVAVTVDDLAAVWAVGASAIAVRWGAAATTPAATPAVATPTAVCLSSPRRVSFAIELSSHQDRCDPSVFMRTRFDCSLSQLPTDR